MSVAGRSMPAKRRLITSYPQLVDELRRRREALSLSQADVDHRTGLADSYCSHLEKPDSPHGRIAGKLSLFEWCAALNVALVLVPVEPQHPHAPALGTVHTHRRAA
jgi:hypothetical protein